MSKAGVIIIEGHVQGLSNARSLGEAGIPVYVLDISNCIARYSKYCKKFFKCPDYNEDEFAFFLIKLAEKEKLNNWILLASNDHALITISKFKKNLEKYYKIITPEYKILEGIYDKLKLLNHAAVIEIPFPNFFNLSESHENIKFPVLIKGRFGLSFYKQFGKKAFLIKNEEDLKTWKVNNQQKNGFNNIFIQELIPFDKTNKTISFTAFCEKGEIKTFWMGAKLREHPIQFGTATLAESVYVDECYLNSVKLIQSLNFTGVCEIEYLRDPRDGLYKLIEINARTWLWVGLAKKCGIDYAKYIYYYLNDMPVNFPKDYTLGIKWINYFTDTVFSIKAILSGKLRISEYLRLLKGQKIPAIFQNDDKMPGIMFLLLLPYIIFKRT